MTDKKPLSDVHPDWCRPMPQSYPRDWRSRNWTSIEVDADGDVVVSWEESSDDYHGGARTRQSEPIPRAVLLAALGVSDG